MNFQFMECPTPFSLRAQSRVRALISACTIAFALPASAQIFDADIPGFDEGAFADGEVEIVNGKVIVKENPPKKNEEKPEADPAGDQVLELTDGSQLHGRLVALARNEVVWQRADATEPLIFTPQEVRRLVLAKTVPKPAGSNATLKLTGSDWLAGNLLEFKDGQFALQLSGEEPIRVAQDRVEWIALSPGSSPDTYDGPIGPMGLAGWEMAVEAGGAWDYADGALVAKNASPIIRQFEILPELLDIQFTAGDGGSSNRGLTLWLQPGNRTRGYAKGSCYLRFQSNSVNGNFSTEEQMKNFNAAIADEKDGKKLTRYRLLFDRRGGRLVIFVNGKQVADWDLPENSSPTTNGNLSWQPSYWSSNMAWTLSNVRVQPWDGTLTPDPTEEEKDKDVLAVASQARKAGKLEGIDAENVHFGDAPVSRKEAMLLRLAPKAAAEPPPSAIARVWLTQRGEFDVTGIGFRDGMLKVRTSFAGDLSLPVGAIRAIEFPHKAGVAERNAQEGGDVLIFKNGDQLRGTLLAASHNEPLRWKPIKGDKPVEFATERLAGVVLARRRATADIVEPEEGDLSVAVRLHNGDWLPGELVNMDGGKVVLRTALSGDIEIVRDAVKTLYLSSAGEAPVWDGASERETWTRGTSVPGYWGDTGSRARKDDRGPGPWRYLDGAFTLVSTSTNRNYNNGPNLGRTLNALSDKVEVSFTLGTAKGPASYSVQLFFDENKPGFMVQGGWDSAYLYDMSPRKNGGVFFNQPQQLDFGEKIGSDGNERHFRFLAERKAGRIWMYVNGYLVGSLSKRPTGGGDNPKGKGISIIPQPLMSRVTVSNLWVAPWSGILPDAPLAKARAQEAEHPAVAAPAPEPGQAPAPVVPAEPKPEKPEQPQEPEPSKASPVLPVHPDTVALTNGDETTGTVVRATKETLTLDCDVGELEIPLLRASLIDFAAKPAPERIGIRLRFVGKGALTVDSMRFEGDKVICQSSAAGDLTFPLSQIAEIIYQSKANLAGTAGTVPAQTAADAKPRTPVLAR